jgi:hypothetical protein
MKHSVKLIGVDVHICQQNKNRETLAGPTSNLCFSPSSPTEFLITQLKLPAILIKSNPEEFGTT